MTERTCLFRNALIVTGAATQLPFHGWVLVGGRRIVAIGTSAQPPRQADEMIDCDGMVLMPGMVNVHAHSHSSLTRGTAEGTALADWLSDIEREQRLLTEEEEFVGAKATYGEALLSGTTTIMDMCLHPAAAFVAAEQTGIRATIAPYVADRKPFTPGLDVTARMLEKISNTDVERVRVWVGLHDLESCSDEQILAGVELAKAYDVGLHLHCSETRQGCDKTLQRTGLSPVALLDRLSALGGQTLLAHGVWLTEDDMQRLSRSGTSVAHCPHANLKLGSGIAPVPQMIDAGINVALATDGAKANNRLDMFDVAKFASLLHKGVHRDPSLLPARQILGMATQGGARALGLRKTGLVAVGYAADIVLVDTASLHLQPCTPETVETNLVHAAMGSDVDLVMVDGQVLVRSGQLVSEDHRRAVEQQRQVGSMLIARSRADAEPVETNAVHADG